MKTAPDMVDSMMLPRMEEERFFMSPRLWVGIVLPVLLLAVIYRDSLAYMMERWATDENYGHGFFVPVISAYLIWERRTTLKGLDLRGFWWGFPVVLLGVAMYIAGELSTLHVVLLLSLWVVVVGLIVASIGPRGAREITFPLLFLLTVIPLPHFLYQGLSQQLQLISSGLGVGCLQVIGITAFRDGNVIDLGPIQLQVVEACSGLRYLFPLATLALICAYLFQAPLWKRLVLFLSSFPISILLNGFRIGMIGVLVELYGQGPAEGFFHFFEGWLLFVASLALLFLEMWVLACLAPGGRGRSFSSFFGLPPIAASGSQGREAEGRRTSPPRLTPAYRYSLILLVPAAIASTQVMAFEERPPSRESFLDFPMKVETWDGKAAALDKIYVDTLKFDDYVLADYRNQQEQNVNFYVAYYRSQKTGQSAHSPRTCIPGGGWEITSLEQVQLEDAAGSGGALNVNRAIIQKGDVKQIVVYWFQQRGRVLTNEYMVKFYLLWDAVTKQRSDGALVRLTAVVPPGTSESQVDMNLAAFAKSVRPQLARYVPD